MRNWMIRIGVAAAGLLTSASLALAADASPGACRAGTLYLTFDTGSMSQAELIARTLRKHHIRATFFLANEPTVNHDNCLLYTSPSPRDQRGSRMPSSA